MSEPRVFDHGLLRSAERLDFARSGLTEGLVEVGHQFGGGFVGHRPERAECTSDLGFKGDAAERPWRRPLSCPGRGQGRGAE